MVPVVALIAEGDKIRWSLVKNPPISPVVNVQVSALVADSALVFVILKAGSALLLPFRAGQVVEVFLIPFFV